MQICRFKYFTKYKGKHTTFLICSRRAHQRALTRSGTCTAIWELEQWVPSGRETSCFGREASGQYRPTGLSTGSELRSHHCVWRQSAAQLPVHINTSVRQLGHVVIHVWLSDIDRNRIEVAEEGKTYQTWYKSFLTNKTFTWRRTRQSLYWNLVCTVPSLLLQPEQDECRL